MNKFQQAYIDAAQAVSDQDEVLDGFWNDLVSEVDYYLSENKTMSVEVACECVINDSYWGPFHMKLLVQACYLHNERAGIFWHHFLENFDDFMTNEAPKLLLKAWRKKYPQAK